MFYALCIYVCPMFCCLILKLFFTLMMQVNKQTLPSFMQHCQLLVPDTKTYPTSASFSNNQISAALAWKCMYVTAPCVSYSGQVLMSHFTSGVNWYCCTFKWSLWGEWAQREWWLTVPGRGGQRFSCILHYPQEGWQKRISHPLWHVSRLNGEEILR